MTIFYKNSYIYKFSRVTHLPRQRKAGVNRIKDNGREENGREENGREENGRGGGL